MIFFEKMIKEASSLSVIFSLTSCALASNANKKIAADSAILASSFVSYLWVVS
jgi:hypothetical protein